jgi:hypothetical protein
MNKDMMKILRIAAIQGLALGLALPAAAGQSHQQAAADNQVAQSKQSDSTQQAAPSTSNATTSDAATGPQMPRGKNAADRSNAKKHPPTAQMDAATPTEKTGESNNASGNNAGASGNASGVSGNNATGTSSAIGTSGNNVGNDKSTTANRKHPPTNVMDRAAPDEKSPAGSTSQSTK